MKNKNKIDLKWVSINSKDGILKYDGNLTEDQKKEISGIWKECFKKSQ